MQNLFNKVWKKENLLFLVNTNTLDTVKHLIKSKELINYFNDMLQARMVLLVKFNIFS